MSWRRFCKTFWKRLEDVLARRLEDILKTSWKRLEDVLKTYSQDEYIDLDQGVLKTSSQDVRLKRTYSSWSRRFEDVLKTSSEDEGERRLQDVFIKTNVYWVVGANSVVKNFIFRCDDSCRFRGRFGEQKMADLPVCRLTETAPFTHWGVHIFGSFILNQREHVVKRYGAMFTCMASRAVHIEVTFSFDTDSLILALRRLTARRGNVRSIYSNNGTNFIGAERELRKA